MKNNQTFILKGIKADEVLKKYLSGGFADEKKTKGPKSLAPIMLAPLTLGNSNDPVYIYRESSGKAKTMTFSNQVEFDNFIYDVNVEKTCGYCLEKFPAMSETKCTIPILKDVEKIDGQDVIVYFGENIYHDTTCAYADFMELTCRPSRFSDVLYDKSEKYLREIHEMIHPGTDLKRANDRRLLKLFGGALDYPEWSIKNGHFVRNISFIVKPVKIGYDLQ